MIEDVKDNGVVLVTGAAGFIGSHVCQRLLRDLPLLQVVGIDNFNDYYSTQLKRDRVTALVDHERFTMEEIDISEFTEFSKVFDEYTFDAVIHLAAQAGVRYSLSNPFAYERSNNLGFLNLLELMRSHEITNLVFASSSSVYGGITEYPFRENMPLTQPLSVYASTKISNELTAYTYHHLFGINAIGLRFFTVYGPWGRPDMSPSLFADAILRDQPIKVFNNGEMMRDFTYMDDVVSGVILAYNKTAELGYEIFNIGCSQPVKLLDFIDEIEKGLGKEAQKEFLPLQPGDVVSTYADVSKAQKLLGYEPTTSVHDGVQTFTQWYIAYFNGQL